MSVLPFTRGNSAAHVALARVTRQLEKVTDELIRALFTRTRAPSAELEARIVELELKRDELHERLATLEDWSTSFPATATAPSSEDSKIAS